MCGICGIVDLHAGAVSESELTALRDGLRHRGPDDAGIHVEQGVGLGARRLSIIDLSARGHMPMPDAEGRHWVTYNGEIYNYPALREELEKRGHVFRSDADTEVLLHAYREWGDDCVTHLSGMFAFALWDRERRRLLLARDRLGVKPLFYAFSGTRLVFASEAHVLYRFLEPGPDQIDPLALDYFLGFGYVPPDRGFVRGIDKLPPAHRMVLDEKGLSRERYWQVRFRPQRRLALPDLLDELDARIEHAVVRRLRSDVPLGCFLSGGIDSGLVTAYAARGSAEPLRTFSVGFAGMAEADDERPLARLVAERYGTRHQELLVEPDHRSVLARLLYHMGEPFADVGALPMLEISRAAREHITVALSGDGGDESFAGYANVRAAALAERVRGALPASLQVGLRRLLSSPALERRIARAGVAARWLERFVERSALEQCDSATHWTRARRAGLYSEEARARLRDADASDLPAALHAGAGDLCDGELHLYTDLHLRLAGDYLPKVDIASSEPSLEVRSPFLDHELVEFAASLPFEQKLLGGRQKGLLRLLAERHLPRELIAAPKRGFAPRIGPWLSGEWSDLLHELLDEPRTVAAGIFRPDAIQTAVREHLAGRGDHATRLWILICLEIWWRLFVDQSLELDAEL